MPRTTGIYRTSTTAGEAVRAFVPHPLPPADPALRITGDIERLHAEAITGLARLEVAGRMVPSTGWFLYGFVRKEAVITSQIEGTQATLREVVTFEATKEAQRPHDVEEVCNYVEAIRYARAELANPSGLPLSVRMLCESHKRLMKGARGAAKAPGQIRRMQNWIGGKRPGDALFVPPPAEDVPAAMATWSDGFTATTHSRLSSRPGSLTSSSRPSTRSSTATAASDACSSRCCSSTGSSCRARCCT